MRPEGEAEALARAKGRLDRLRFYPRPVDASRVSIHIVPWLFRVPGFRRFRGYATFRRILLKRSVLDEDLIVHELCHVWQAQHRPIPDVAVLPAAVDVQRRPPGVPGQSL